MEATFSALSLKRFELIRSNYEFHAPKEDEVEIPSLFDSYAVDIDFEHQFQDDNQFLVFVKIAVNHHDEFKVGYSLVAEGLGTFEINKSEELTEEQLSNLKFYSTVNMMINNLRNVMHRITNMGPMDGYLLPPVDILDLFQKKKEEMSE